MQLAHAIAQLRTADRVLAEALVLVSERHAQDAEVHEGARRLAAWSAAHVIALERFVDRYRRAVARGPRRVRAALFRRAVPGGPGLLGDLQDLGLLAQQVHLSALAVGQAAQAIQDAELHEAVVRLGSETDRQIAWIRTQVQLAAAQALTVPADVGSRMESLPTFPWGPAVLVLAAAAGVGTRNRRGGAATGVAAALAAAALWGSLRNVGRRVTRPVGARKRLARAREDMRASALPL